VYQRFRLWIDTNWEGKYGGTLGLEWNWTWGKGDDSTVFNDPLSGFGESNTAEPLPVGERWIDKGERKGPHGEDTTGNTRVKHAYVWFLIPGTPVKMTAGLMGMGIDPDGLMHSGGGDGFGIRMDTPLIKGVLNLSSAWMKWDEGSDTIQDTDDTDVYWLNLTGSLAKWLTFGTYFEWLHSRAGSVGGTVGAGGSFAGTRLSYPLYGGDYFWYGIHASANPGNFYSRLHFNYFWGKTSVDHFPGQVPWDDTKASGWALIGRAGMRFGPARIGLRGHYMSGNKEEAMDAGGDWNRWGGPGTWFYTSGYEIFFDGNQWAKNSSGNATNPGGTATIALDTSWQVTKKLRLWLIGGYIWSTNSWDKGEFAVFEPDGTRNESKNLGFEIDVGSVYKIYPHLSLDLVAAWFIADKGLDHLAVYDAPQIYNGDGEADNAYEFFWRLVYTF
jgi:hypothetical protein